MRIIEINSMPVGSTGKIMFDIGAYAKKKGHEVLFCYPEFDAKINLEYAKQTYIIGNNVETFIAHLWGRVTGYNDTLSYCATKKLIKKILDFKPDIIHIHNLHNCYLNMDILWRFFADINIPVVWTLHDCWSFTGGCAYFERKNCYKWVEGKCDNCEMLTTYPKSYIDRTNRVYQKKKDLFTKKKELYLITPSGWLKEYVKKSFLSTKEIYVINNGVNQEIFRNTPNDIKIQLGIQDKIMLLGVASVFEERKGIDDFITLGNILPNQYQLVLIGRMPDEIKKQLPRAIIIDALSDQFELAKYYSAADVFINPTLEDNYPTTNLEAISCGTPVITYRVGGSPESVDDTSGIVLERRDVKGIIEGVNTILAENNKYKKGCSSAAVKFGDDIMSDNYLKIFDAKVQ